jgi:spore coat polysaccharide biosynthesis predicted glycosyltransferase SpsG/RimJ/RimL family protein N-acetyltransferase
VRVVVHCNGGPAMGVGHVTRSLALAEEAVSSGHDVTLVGEYDGQFLLSQLDAAPVAVRRVDRSDRAALRKVLRELEPEVLHLDSYDPVALDGAGLLVSNIEDSRYGRRPADVVVDPTLGAETEPREVRPPRALLRGSRYAPLRAAVVARRGEWQLREEARRVLVVMGGADPLNLTPKVLDVLARTEVPLHVTAIVRPDARAACEEQAASLTGGMQVDLVPPVDDLPALMAHQDLVVSAAGTSVWELCCLGVPSALVCAVENQWVGYSRVVAGGAAVGLGRTLDGEEREDAVKQLCAVLENPATRQDLARQAARLVDGLGAWRIVRAWEQLARSAPESGSGPDAGLGIRPASIADADRLLRWRNDPETRSASRHHEEVSRELHLAWLEETIGREDRLLTVVFDERGDLGTVRWDRIGDGEWEVSITLVPERRGEHLSAAVLHTGEQHLLRSREDAVAFYASVLERNPASRRLFEHAGYLLDAPADEDGFLTYRKALRG